MSDDDKRVLETLETLKRAIAEQVAPDDHQTHFELGVAYVQMGMLDDAVREFESVLRVEPVHVGARAELEAVRVRRRSEHPPVN